MIVSVGEKFVNDRIDAGADIIKILREPSRATIDFPEIEKVIETAHSRNRLVISHISKAEDAVEIAKLGGDGFAHIWYDEKISDQGLQAIVDSKAFMVPTLAVIKKLIETSATRPDLAKRISLDLDLNLVKNEVKRCYDAGVKILAGTDPPNLGLNYGTHLYDEIILLAEAGLPNEEALKAATSNISKVLNLPQFGFVKKGVAANIILINGDPLKNIEAIKQVESVWKNGKRIE